MKGTENFLWEQGETGHQDCYKALEVFFLVLLTLTRLMAPFTPFITEHIYQNLRRVVKKSTAAKNDESIHFLMLPDPQYVKNSYFKKQVFIFILYYYENSCDCREWLIDQEIEKAVEGMQKVIELGRVSRDRRTLPIKVKQIIHS